MVEVEVGASSMPPFAELPHRGADAGVTSAYPVLPSTADAHRRAFAFRI
jgi:hypothetical protein